MIAKFGKGKYFIGDICYALSEHNYDKIWGDKYHNECGEFLIGKDKFAVSQTAYGDGRYRGSDGWYYSVDAGVIGVVPKKLWKQGKAPTGGRIIIAKKKLTFDTEECGVFVIHVDDEITIKINTSDEVDENDTCSECGREL